MIEFHSLAVVGLGNPGKKYEGTIHNIGFLILDSLLETWRLSWSTKYEGLYAQSTVDSKRLFLLKPQTFMNLSGQSVGPMARFCKPDAVLVVQDDIDQVPGALKLVFNGGPGGHNGIKSIYELYGKEIWRLKVGVGRPPPGDGAASHVLSAPRGEEKKIFEYSIQVGAEAVHSFINHGPEQTMTRYNKKHTPPS